MFYVVLFFAMTYAEVKKEVRIKNVYSYTGLHIEGEQMESM
jgi:hypothetical protein